MPSLSAASAVTVIADADERMELFKGSIMLTVGERFDAVMVRLTGDDVVTAPLLSVALAVKIWFPITALVK